MTKRIVWTAPEAELLLAEAVAKNKTLAGVIKSLGLLIGLAYLTLKHTKVYGLKFDMMLCQ